MVSTSASGPFADLATRMVARCSRSWGCTCSWPSPTAASPLIPLAWSCWRVTQPARSWRAAVGFGRTFAVVAARARSDPRRSDRVSAGERPVPTRRGSRASAHAVVRCALAIAAEVAVVVTAMRILVSWPEHVVPSIAVAPCSCPPRSSPPRRSVGRSCRSGAHLLRLARGAQRRGGRRLPAHRARARPRADGRRADAARAVDARRRCRRAALVAGARAPHERSRTAASTASGTRPTRCSARSAAASRARCRSTSCCSSSPSR